MSDRQGRDESDQTMSERIEYHIGRSFSGARLEDGCPCPKAPCGLVLAAGRGIDPDCPEHSLAAGKTIRQTHRADACPALVNGADQ